jgi:hypothetical protein
LIALATINIHRSPFTLPFSPFQIYRSREHGGVAGRALPIAE